MLTLLHCVHLLITSFLRLAILRVHAHGLVTIDLQCYEEDNIAQLDNVGDYLKKKKYSIQYPFTHRKSHSASCHFMLLTLRIVNK